MLTVIQTGAKQYLISEGGTIRIEKIPGEAGASVSFDKVLLVDDGERIRLGTPYVEGAVVEASIVQQGREDKVIVGKFKRKTGYKRKHGHRQPYTELRVNRIST